MLTQTKKGNMGLQKFADFCNLKLYIILEYIIMTKPINWNLDTIFEGGSQSESLAMFINEMAELVAKVEKIELPPELNEKTQPVWVHAIQATYDVLARLWQASAFAHCLVAQDTNDTLADQVLAHIDEYHARYRALIARLSHASAQQNDDVWQVLLEDEAIHPTTFFLNNQRTLGRKKTLVEELAKDGYHAWQRVYNNMVGAKKIEFEENGQVKLMSVGQLQDKYMHASSRESRKKAFNAYSNAWQELAPICAMSLNNQAGFRLTMYRHRGWDSVLSEPLRNNHLTRQTLDTMWSVVAEKSHKLLDFMSAKAKLLGIDRLAWFDLIAGIGQAEREFTFAEAGDFIVDGMRSVDNNLADYCRMALDKEWVEAENRSTKRQGGFCTSFPLTKESRIFMTFDGSFDSLLTLAHELGHGYHHWVMRDLPVGDRIYGMNLAETASIFNELVTTDAALRNAKSDMESLIILNEKLSNAITYLMNIKARFDFETAFFAKRAEKQLSIDELSELMLSAQKGAFHHAMPENDYLPLFWAAKLHFYNTQTPFYNFPYTFGFLFSQGTYWQALKMGADFSKQYIALLEDTGRMDTETLARKHFGVDLTQPSFWEEAVDHILKDVDTFVALADKISE